MKAIGTRYAGRRFRSRLEARYAVLFDALGLDWDYEPEGFETPFGRYLPDFFIRPHAASPKALQHPGFGVWVEIKPSRPETDELEKLSAVAKGTACGGLLLWGQPNKAVGVLFSQEGHTRASEIAWLGLADFLDPDSEDYPGDLWRASVAKATAARFEFGENGT